MKEFLRTMTTTWWGILIICIMCVAVWTLLSAVLYRAFFKRFYDIVLSFVAIIVFSPLLLVLTIVGAIAMKGNPFFVQKRPGRRKKLSKKECAKRGVSYGTYGEEKIINLLKFRTMTNTKDADGNFLPDKDRLNKYGKFLRSTSLDEIPSILNIFVGSLSIVGPRPLLVKYLPYYTEKEKHRHDVRPGLTGLAQVNGRNYLSWEETFEYDLQYRYSISLWKDIKISLLTVKKVLNREDITEDTGVRGSNSMGKVSYDPLDVERERKNNMQKVIAIMGTGILTKNLIQRAKSLGIIVHCFGLSDDEELRALTTNCHHIDIFAIDTIVDICRKANVNGIIATTEMTILPTAQVAQALGLQGISCNAAKNVTDKYYVRNRTKEIAELSTPNVIQISKMQCIPEINFYPVIVKPDYAGGKRGVSIAYSKDELDVAIKNAFSFTRNDKVLIEEFIDSGQEYSVETLSYKGKNRIIQITEKDSSGPPHFVELGHHQPALLDAEMRSAIERIVDKALCAIEYSHGLSHTEIKITKGKVYIIEINCRPGGDFITYPLTELSTGYPILTAMIYAALGELEETEIAVGEGAFCGVYFVTQKTSWLKPIFDTCDQKSWLYKKHKETDFLSEMDHNDCEHINYMIYCSKEGKLSFNKQELHL